jgi:pimeloyl-ACP methyl ester carboxylesterase
MFSSQCLAAFVAFCLGACAATPPPAPTPSRSTWSAHASVGPSLFTVEVHGHGAPMILIPGLASSGDVWRDFILHYADRYEMHVLTLAGFAGRAAVPGMTLEAVRDELARYVRARGLGRPIVVGHSMGASLAFALAKEEPALVGAVVAVDGVPYLPALRDPGATPDAMAASARQVADRIVHAGPEARRASTHALIATMVSEPSVAARIEAWSLASDPGTIGDAVVELETHDLRVGEERIVAPVLLLAAGKEATTPEARAALTAAYEAQVARIPRHRVVLAENARHFVMLDDPAFLYAAIDGFTPIVHARGDER